MLLVKEHTLASLCEEADNKDKGIGIRSLVITLIPYNHYGVEMMFKAIVYTVSEKVFFKA